MPQVASVNASLMIGLDPGLSICTRKFCAIGRGIFFDVVLIQLNSSFDRLHVDAEI